MVPRWPRGWAVLSMKSCYFYPSNVVCLFLCDGEVYFTLIPGFQDSLSNALFLNNCDLLFLGGVGKFGVAVVTIFVMSLLSNVSSSSFKVVKFINFSGCCFFVLLNNLCLFLESWFLWAIITIPQSEVLINNGKVFLTVLQAEQYGIKGQVCMGESSPPGFRLLLSSHDGRGKGSFLSFFYKGINLIPEDSPSLSNNLLQILSPNIVILAMRFFQHINLARTQIFGPQFLVKIFSSVFF